MANKVELKEPKGQIIIDDLLNYLLQDSSKNWKELANLLNVSDTAVRKRVNNLKKEGIIKRFTIEIDPRKLGYELSSFIGFDVDAESYIQTIEEVKEWSEVRSIFQTSLDHDFLMECWFTDNDHLTVFLRNLEQLSGITKVCPATVIQRLK
ncbi:MAG: Lrp/AsnC family transcriptional regulator [Candidatus Hodarchaeales archaeon]|jgi:Lrp/AsnC family transcriptional regulator for asnA, asnC and gidA